MSYRNIRYYKGDVIGVLLQGVKGRVTYSLIDFNDSCLTLETGERIPFSRIRAIVRGPERGSIVAQYAKVGFVAAGLYLVLDLANSDFVPAPSTFWVSGAIAASAAACLPFKYRRHRTARGWRLYYVQPEPASQQGSTP
jgi:hypothetical protein